MSMLARLGAVNPAVADRLGGEPELIFDLLDIDPDAARKARRGLIARLIGKLSAEAPRQRRLPPIADADCFDLDHHWHVLHYLFTGTAWEGALPEGFIAAAGAEIGDIDVGYGPARLFTPEEVRGIAAFLDRLTRDDLRRRYVPPEIAAAEIYGSGTPDADDAEMHVDDLFSIVQEVRVFVRGVADRGDAMLVYIY